MLAETSDSGTRRNPVPPQHVRDGARAGGRGHRLPHGKHLKWLDQYRRLGYTFVRNGHLKVFDPAGLLVTSISCTGSDSEHHKSKTHLRRHERTRSGGHG